MFEKEAEEYAIENWEHYEEGQNDSKALKQAYLAGAEFGYNKAFVEADKNLKAIVTDFNKANERLIKAKEIIKDYMTIAKGSHTTVCGVQEENRTIYVLKLNEEAEQFLNGEVEK